MKIEVCCGVCGKTFTADRRNKKYCSSECYQKHQCEEKCKAWAENRAKRLAEKKKIETMKACKHIDCIFRSSGVGGSIVTCDYILKMRAPRGCKISECDKYIPKGEVRK